jgi:hypothetical protein
MYRAITLAFIAIVLSSIIILRELKDKPVYPNGESYFKLRIAKELVSDPLYGEDSLQNRPYYLNLHNFFISNLISVFGEKNTAYFAPVILGLIFAFAFYSLMLNMGFPRNNALFATLLIGFAPAFIAAFSTLSSYGFIALLSVVTLAAYFEKDYWDSPWKTSGKVYFALAIFVLAILSLTSLVGFVLTILMLLGFSVFEGRSLKSLAFAASGPIIIFIPLAAFTGYASYELKTLGFHLLDINEIFSIFGSRFGLDIFLLLLFFTGLVIIWRYFPNLRLYHFFAILLVIASFFNPLLRLYASLIITVYCVIAIKHLYYNKWELESVKAGTMILLICALVFSSLNQINTLANAEPSVDAKEAMLALSQQESGVVFTEPRYGFLVQYLAGKKTMLDDSSQNFELYYDTMGDYKYMLGLSRLKEAEPMIVKHSIKYVLITPEMKHSIWDNKEKGLLLLLRNSGKFARVPTANAGEFELWEYRG